MSEKTVVAIRKRQYKIALLEAQRAIQLEVDSLEKDDGTFEPSEGISGIVINLAKHQWTLTGVIEGAIME